MLGHKKKGGLIGYIRVYLQTTVGIIHPVGNLHIMGLINSLIVLLTNCSMTVVDWIGYE